MGEQDLVTPFFNPFTSEFESGPSAFLGLNEKAPPVPAEDIACVPDENGNYVEGACLTRAAAPGSASFEKTHSGYPIGWRCVAVSRGLTTWLAPGQFLRRGLDLRQIALRGHPR